MDFPFNIASVFRLACRIYNRKNKNDEWSINCPNIIKKY